MTYLLDVNALLALAIREHEHHASAVAWLVNLRKQEQTVFATCSIVELGFVRVLAQAPQYALALRTAIELLGRLRSEARPPFVFLHDGVELRSLPRWVSGPKQLTDGHLFALAKAHGAALATFDQRIPGAHVIPRLDQTDA